MWVFFNMIAELIPKVPSIPVVAVRAGNLRNAFEALTAAQRNWAQEQNFSAKFGEVLMLPDDEGTLDVVLFGMGNDRDRERERLIFGKLPGVLPNGNYHLVVSDEDAELASLSWLLSSYNFDHFKAGSNNFPKLVAHENVDMERINIIVRSAHMAMDLINRPANDLNPQVFEDVVSKLANEIGANFESTSGTKLNVRNFPLIEAVGQASIYPPRLLELKWGDEGHPTVTLVGKGVCFDTGGLNLKPGSSMGNMKKDMGGAANVLALARMIIETRLPVNLHVILPVVENSVGSNSMRPGDILTARNGMTVEVNNTDAEGRLILADSLAYASENNNDLLVSMATLTGAARVALGTDLMPFFTDDDAFSQALTEHSAKVRDPLWRMPFWAPYETMIEPAYADLDNAPKGGMGGAITAALFLRRFAHNQPFVHFDIFGWTPNELPGRPQGGAVQGARALFSYLEERYGED